MVGPWPAEPALVKKSSANLRELLGGSQATFERLCRESWLPPALPPFSCSRVRIAIRHRKARGVRGGQAVRGRRPVRLQGARLALQRGEAAPPLAGQQAVAVAVAA